MKVAILALTPELFIEFGKACQRQGYGRRLSVKENALPDDAKVIAVESDGRGDLSLLISSSSFDDVQRPYPILPAVVFETIYDEQ